MAKKRVKPSPPTPEEKLEYDLRDKRRRLNFIPEPTYYFAPGDKVHIGNLHEPRIVEVLDDGKIYLFEFNNTHYENNYNGNRTERELVIDGPVRRYAYWFDLRPLHTTKESIIRNGDIRLNFSTRTIDSIFSIAYHFGLDMDPDYQRGYVWTDEDKVNLIDSVFNNIDIGKFVFVHNEYMDEYLYEILDGKQRVRALLDYYENRFPYKGKYFNDLSLRDQFWFCQRTISVAEVDKTNRKALLQYFLMLNTAGKTMAKEHLNTIRQMVEECGEE